MFNTSGNDGTITRFGWKAQNKSLLIFAGEAYNVEQGVTNELFDNPRGNDPACLFNNDPEDATNITPDSGAAHVGVLGRRRPVRDVHAAVGAADAGPGHGLDPKRRDACSIRSGARLVTARR